MQAPSIEELRNRLVQRGDTAPDEIENRIGKAEYEMTFSKYADRVIVNDNLDKAKEEVLAVVNKFLNE